MKQLPRPLLNSFIDAYEKAHGVRLDPVHANEVGIRMLETLSLILRINARAIQKEWDAQLDDSQNKRDTR